MSATPVGPHDWAVVLGASSGFGAATSVALAKAGFQIVGVHLDRRTTQALADQVAADIRRAGREALFFNVNAADGAKRKEIIQTLVTRRQQAPDTAVKVLFHSLAFGTLKPYITDRPEDALTQPQMEMTLDVMANSLVYWAQELFSAKLLVKGSRIFSMTSSGGTRVWRSYGAVSAAKAALESHTRQLALELAPHGVTVNCIRAGVTDTPALRKIPGSDEMIEVAKARNPGRRLTTPDDIATAVVTLCNSGTGWVTGNVIGVDGGEDVVG